MENLENDAKKAELLSDEELKNVSGGGIDYNAPMTMLHIHVCESIGHREECEQHDFCIWQVGPSYRYKGHCKYNGAK
jgi:bacteriocin-like protein